jgi:nicotinamide N-methyltransferase
MSDLLHFHTSHDVLLQSLISLLSKSKTSRAYVAAGNYTPPHVCDSFLRQGELLGIVWEEGERGPAEAEWHGTMEVSGLDKSQLAVRKNVCRWWLGRWAEFEK